MWSIRETMKRFLEPKKQIQLASDIAQKQHFLPRQAAHIQQVRTWIVFNVYDMTLYP